MDLSLFKQQSIGKKRENKRFIQQLKKSDPKKLDQTFHTMHEEVFAETNCLKCANCCKTTSPIFINKDIHRLSRIVQLKPGQFIEKFLNLDHEGDYVLQQSPCPFLLEDNSCAVYESRPRACREYPHTNRKKMAGILDLTFKNTLVCPAVFEILERMK